MEKKMIQIRWHARAGQGAVTAAKMLAECAIAEGNHAQAMPEYGPERSGAPMKAYNRVSASQIRVHAGVTHPDIVCFLDSTLLQVTEYFQDLDENVTVLLNTPKTTEVVRAELKMMRNRVCAIDASRIGEEATGVRFPNLPMLGALAQVSGVVKLESLRVLVRKYMGEKASGDKLEGYVRAVDGGAEAAKKVLGAELEQCHG